MPYQSAGYGGGPTFAPKDPSMEPRSIYNFKSDRPNSPMQTQELRPGELAVGLLRQYKSENNIPENLKKDFYRDKEIYENPPPKITPRGLESLRPLLRQNPYENISLGFNPFKGRPAPQPAQPRGLESARWGTLQ